MKNRTEFTGLDFPSFDYLITRTKMDFFIQNFMVNNRTDPRNKKVDKGRRNCE